jgi:hypothetical protein
MGDIIVELKFAIATNIKYMNQTLPLLFESMEKNKIQKNNIVVFVNESDTDDIKEIDGVTYHHNSGMTYFEWIIPKLIIERKLQTDWWFFLHDTVILGDTFLEKILAHDNKEHEVLRISLQNPNNMAMIKNSVFLKQEYVNYIIESLDKLSNINDVLQRKKWIVTHEDEYLTKASSLQRTAFYNLIVQDYLEEKEYCGVKRYVEYFENIDLYKMKKNNGREGTTLSTSL